ncbi:MAG: alkyl sulfatase [Actinomycetota bacterium]|jgi:alpha-ketoglutarate-dependent taurine dioxygenase|nr:alkyl sulfatase [Actinomycetota bacterium]
MTIHAANRKLEVRPVTSVIGAEVDGIDLRQPLDADAVAEIGDALLRWKVLFFRNQPISYDQQMDFARNFGELTPAHPIEPGLVDKPEIYVVDSREEKKLFGHGQERARFAPPRLTQTGWHTDITFVANPALASVLRGAVVPPYGGDTLWTNLVAAYQELSEPIRELVDHLQAVHRWHGFTGETREGYDPNQPPPSAVHPVVRVHPVTGERALFVNPSFTRYLVGVTDRENRYLLDLLFDQIARPEFTVRFRWETDSLAFWDNRATAHLGPVDLASSDFDRRVERVTIAGDIPVGPDGFRSVQLRGELFS